MLMQTDERELPEWLQRIADDAEATEREMILQRRAEFQRASTRYARLELAVVVCLCLAVVAIAAWALGTPAP